MKEKGLIFDGFTYYKPEITPHKQRDFPSIAEEDYSP